jgi:Ran GTPase-activating protein (RanGAP) involved in mRNA processing and transport
MGVAGAKFFAEALAKSTSLKSVNLFNNKIAFEGAKCLGAALAKNESLEFLEVGHNRIRDKGLKMIIEGIGKNGKCKIHTLGLRFNFLTLLGMEKFIQLCKSTPVKEIFIRNNSINENGVYRLEKMISESGTKLIVDVF